MTTSKGTPTAPGTLLGSSAPMQDLVARIAQIADNPLPVLVIGETGTGKEVVARALHQASGRRGPFVPVDCAALATHLVESELFGHERGAFTGAARKREGLVWAANGGTFFLDEIAELPLDAQTRLLRLLQEGTYRPVGSESERAADIRVIAATWRDLSAAVTEGRFRRDLFHRLAVFELKLPPLRRRDDDIETLFQHFLLEECGKSGRAVPSLEPALRAHLRRWPWPGNVRELKNVASYLAAMSRGPRLGVADLPAPHRREPPVLADGHAQTPPGPPIRIDLPYLEARRVWLDEFQFRYIAAQLEAHDGNVSRAARAAGMDRRSIQRILGRGRNDDG